MRVLNIPNDLSTLREGVKSPKFPKNASIYILIEYTQ